MPFTTLFQFYQFLQPSFLSPLFLLFPIYSSSSKLFVLEKETSNAYPHLGILSFQAQKDDVSPPSEKFESKSVYAVLSRLSQY